MFSQYSLRTLVSKATTDDDTPTPGYLYNDISKITFKSLKECQALEDYLLSQLAKKESPLVKLKILRILRHVITKGDVSFRRDLQRRLGPIKSCLGYRGPPDPVHGDAYYRSVREEAQQVLNALFDVEENPTNDPTETEREKRGTTVPAPQAASPETSSIPTDVSFTVPSAECGSPGGRKYMPGMGNTDYTPSHGPATERSGFSFMSFLQPKQQEHEDRPPSVHYSPAVLTYPTSTPSSHKRSHAERVPGRPAGGWEGNDEGIISSIPRMMEASNLHAPLEDPTLYQPPSSKSNETVVPHAAASDGSYEKQIVREITAGGGVRLAPTPQALHLFHQRLTTSDINILIAELLELMRVEQPWQTIVRASHALLEVVHSDRGKEARPHLLGADASSALQILSSHRQAPVRRIVTSLMQELGLSAPKYVAEEPTTGPNVVSKEELIGDVSAERGVDTFFSSAVKELPHDSPKQLFSFDTDTPPLAAVEQRRAVNSPTAAPPTSSSDLVNELMSLDLSRPSLHNVNISPAVYLQPQPSTSGVAYYAYYVPNLYLAPSMPKPATQEGRAFDSNAFTFMKEQPKADSLFDFVQEEIKAKLP